MNLSRRVFVSSLAAAAALPSLATRQKAGAPADRRRPRARSVPGGVALISLGASAQRPIARVDDGPLLVAGSPAQWTAVVGIPLSATSGPAQLRAQAPG